MTKNVYKSLFSNSKEKKIIEFKRINLSIEGNYFFNNLFFKIDTPGITLIMGPNGAGKTLCMKVIAGLIAPESGLIRFNKLKPRISYVSQKTVFLRRNVYDNLAHALKLNKFSNLEIKKRIESMVLLFNFKEFLFISARRLSFGHQQLLSIMRSLIINPDIILLDEPCSNLEPKLTKMIESILKKVSDTGVKVLLVTHDVMQAKRLAKEILFMHKGRITEKTNKNIFFKSPKSKFARNYIKGELIN